MKLKGNIGQGKTTSNTRTQVHPGSHIPTHIFFMCSHICTWPVRTWVQTTPFRIMVNVVVTKETISIHKLSIFLNRSNTSQDAHQQNYASFGCWEIKIYIIITKNIRYLLWNRWVALLSWHVSYNWGSGNSVHQSFTWFLSVNWRKSTFYRSRVRILFQNKQLTAYCDVIDTWASR